MTNTIKHRVNYKADVEWWDVDINNRDSINGRYTVRIIKPESHNGTFVDVYYNINGKVHNLVTNHDIIAAVREEIEKDINNI